VESLLVSPISKASAMQRVTSTQGMGGIVEGESNVVAAVANGDWMGKKMQKLSKI